MYKSLLATYTHQSTFMNQRKWIEEKNKERVWSQTRRHGRFTKTHIGQVESIETLSNLLDVVAVKSHESVVETVMQ